MIKDLIKWVVPGLATVLGGTTLCVAMTSTQMATDIATATTTAMQASGYDWAELSFDMRDVRLSGTTTDPALVEAAVARLDMMPAIRSVVSDVTLAPMATPYILSAAVGSEGMILSGGVPDETTRKNLVDRAGTASVALDLRSGMPDRRAWTAGAQFAIDNIKYFDEGAITVSDLTVHLDGRAKSERDYRDLLVVMRAGPPTGLTLGDVAIVPPLVSPYFWTATSDGERISVSGFVPDDALAERLRLADVGGLPVATGLALGSGESEDFAGLSQTLLEQLAKLEHGTVLIEGERSSLSGAPPSEDVAQAVIDTLKPSGTIVVLEPPRIADYWVSATRQAGGALVFDGYAPDEATREAFGTRSGADTSFLKLGRGAPERYMSAADFGLAALDLMSEGRFALNGTTVTLSGIARTLDDYDALQAALEQGAPQGLTLAQADIVAPLVKPYLWSATKAQDGSVKLSGFAPNEGAKAVMLSAAGAKAVESLTYASGEPSTFEASTIIALDMMAWLRSGAVVFDGMGWTLTGVPLSPEAQADIEARFSDRKLAASGWSMALEQPVVAVSPYLWSATRSAEGVSLMGHVPTQTLKDALVLASGEGVDDRLSVGAGAPDDFAASAMAALRAVLALDEGEARFDGQAWSLMGRASSDALREETLASLSNQTQSQLWDIDVSAPAAEVSPYVWSAAKAVGSGIIATGNVPAAAFQRFMAIRAGEGFADQTSVSAGAPDGFVEDALAALDALSGLSEGEAGFDGTTWGIAGQLRDEVSADLVNNALASGATPPDAWDIDLAAAPTAVVEPAAAPDVVPVLPPALDPAYSFTAQRSENGPIVLSGQVPAEPAKRYFAAVSDGDVTGLAVADGAPDTFLASAEVGLRALMNMTDGEVRFADQAWSLTGIAPDEAASAQILAALAGDIAGAWKTSIAVAEPPPEAVSAATSSADLAACAVPVAQFSARNAIFFASGASRISPDSDPALDELAIDLAACPSATVHIEGHTDADGEEDQNMALSVARAEAVVNALVQRGVAAERLYAVGYGETAPIADNATAEGKRINRRIVVTVKAGQ